MAGYWPSLWLATAEGEEKRKIKKVKNLNLNKSEKRQ